ncbi:hypothetical protein QBC45DRAFT_80563 [Copromyces sp. CBS 386.78]|nr:hypothetical protein QBC45DRAFT_80563 [Copromyces sp. CBS 386.78]
MLLVSIITVIFSQRIDGLAVRSDRTESQKPRQTNAATRRYTSGRRLRHHILTLRITFRRPKRQPGEPIRSTYPQRLLQMLSLIMPDYCGAGPGVRFDRTVYLRLGRTGQYGVPPLWQPRAAERC